MFQTLCSLTSESKIKFNAKRSYKDYKIIKKTNRNLRICGKIITHIHTIILQLLQIYFIVHNSIIFIMCDNLQFAFFIKRVFFSSLSDYRVHILYDEGEPRALPLVIKERRWNRW